LLAKSAEQARDYDKLKDECSNLKARAFVNTITQVSAAAMLISELAALRGKLGDMRGDLARAEELYASASNNASLFEARMGDLQVENGKLERELAALKSQPSGVVLPRPSEHYPSDSDGDTIAANARNACLDEVARLNSSPVSAGDSALREAVTPDVLEWVRCGLAANNRLIDGDHPALQKLRAALSAPSHGEQVRQMVPDGWLPVPVEPTDEMLIAGDGFIGTPGTYKAMLSAAPCQAISKEFSQFISAVMDAAGLVRHGRQSKELSEYLGKKCMEYRFATVPSAGSQEQGE
jgi:hypothetical protein